MNRYPPGLLSLREHRVSCAFSLGPDRSLSYRGTLENFVCHESLLISGKATVSQR